MARTRLTRRVLRRKNIVHDDEDSEEEEEEGSGGEEDEEEEEEDEEEEEEEEDDDDDEEEEEEEEADEKQRRKPTPVKKAPTPKKKQPLRRGSRKEASEEEEEEEEDKEEDDEEDEEEEVATPSRKRTRSTRSTKNEEVVAVSKRTRTSKIVQDEEDEEEEREKEEDEAMSSANERGKVNEGSVDEDAASVAETETASVAASNSATASASATPMDVDADEMDGESTPQVTPSASPIRRAGLSVDTHGVTDPTSGASVPFQNIRERLRAATSEQALLEVVTDICGSLIKEARPPNRLVSVGFLTVVKEDPQRFRYATVLKYLMRLLRAKHYVPSKDGNDAHSLKKANSTSSIGSANSLTAEMTEIPLPVLLSNILYYVLKDDENWPIDTFKVFIDDSLRSRLWVDHELSQPFVRHLKTIMQDLLVEPHENLRPRFTGIEPGFDMRTVVISQVRARFSELEKDRTGGATAVRNMVLALIDFVRVPQVRVTAAENLDTWLQNPSIKGPTKQLLSKVVANCKTMEPLDRQAVDILLKLKLKPTMFQLKVETVTQVVRQHEGYLRLALQLFISRERPNTMGKDVDNMKMLQQIFRAVRTAPATAPSDDVFFTSPIPHPGATPSRELAVVFRDLAGSNEVAPVLKTMVRKIVKQLSFDHVDTKSLCVGILENDNHWDTLAKYADMRLLDYMSLVTGSVWLTLLMRGAAVKSLQIQQSNAAPSNRQGAGPSSVKLSGAQPIPRRTVQSVAGVRNPKLGGGAFAKGKVQPPTGKASPSSAQGGGNIPVVGSVGASAAGAPAVTTDVSPNSKALSVAVRAKEDLLQALAHVQRQALTSCVEIFEKFGLTGNSSFEKSVYEVIVKKLLFFEIPQDVQPTEHDKTCFLSTKEDIPLHEDTLEMLCKLLTACNSVDRVEALRTVETMVFRAAEGYLKREELWASRIDDLLSYSQNGGIVGIQVQRTDFIMHLLQLSVWQGTDQQKLEHEFCYSSRFWICCSILLIIGAFNPETVGDVLWREMPTLRCMMQMIITGRYEFPPLGSVDPALMGRHQEALSDLGAANTQLIEYEQHVMSTLVPSVEDPLMLFDVQSVARQPPPAIIEHIRVLDRKFRLGVRLRQSRTKDFLMEMVTGPSIAPSSGGVGVKSEAMSSTDSAWWIADIVCEDFETVQYLPYGCLCKLLLIARRGSLSISQNKTSSIGDGMKARQLSRLVPRLQHKLREYLFDAENVETGAQIVAYYLDCFDSTDSQDRRVASQILHVLIHDDADDAIMNSPKSESDGADEHLFADVVDDGNMTFEWLSALLKLPCYPSVRERTFSALESLLERESSVTSLQLCIKALDKFWKFSQDAGPTSRPPASVDPVVQLAIAFSRLLGTREFVCKFMLEDEEICRIFAEVFWTVIQAQLQSDHSEKPANGFRLSECRVFYVVDGSQTVREIKLPLHVIHGAIRVLCSSAIIPHSTGASSAYEKLAESLFPKVKGGSSAIISSTGLIATKDARLYPEQLLKKMVKYSPSQHLVNAAAKALPAESVWEVLCTTGLSATSVNALVLAARDMTRSNDAKAASALRSMGANIIMKQLLLIKATEFSKEPTLSDNLQFILQWVTDKAPTPKGNDDGEDDALEAELLSTDFSKIRVRDVSAPTSKRSFFSKADEEMVDVPIKRSLDLEKVDTSDSGVLTTAYKGAVSIDRAPSSPAAASFVSKISSTLITPCSHEESEGLPLWSRRIAVLHCLHAASNSPRGASQLGSTVLQIIDHIVDCHSFSHRTECVDFVSQAFEMSSTFSFSAARGFISNVTKIQQSQAMRNLKADSVSFKDVLGVLSSVLKGVDDLSRLWLKKSEVVVADSTSLRNIVLLIKSVDLLYRQHLAPSVPVVDGKALLLRLADTDNDVMLVPLLDSILWANPFFPQLDSVAVHQEEIRRDLIQILYFAEPRKVGTHLTALEPSWLSSIRSSHWMTSGGNSVGVMIDAAIKDAQRDFNDGGERLRELALREPALALARLGVILQQWKGSISLTLLYQNSTALSNLMLMIDMIRPTMNGANIDSLQLATQFVLEVLGTVARHQAAEFHQLVARALSILADILQGSGDRESVIALLFGASETEILQSIVALHETVPEIAGFGDILGQVHGSSVQMDQALDAFAEARNNAVASLDEQNQLREFLSRLESPSPIEEELPVSASDLDAMLQLLNQLLSKSQEQGVALPFVQHFAKPLSQILAFPSLSKPTMKSLCQVSLSLVKNDTTAVNFVVPSFIKCLRVQRLGLRESALAFASDFLALTDARQRRELLGLLYFDTSEIGKSKLLTYVKGASFRINS